MSSETETKTETKPAPKQAEKSVELTAFEKSISDKVFEMFGVYFNGHPDNRRLLLPEDWADLPPLRKDFAIKGR